MFKVCGTCKTEKSVEEFNWKKKDLYRNSVCRSCHSVYRKQHYKDNKQKYIDKARKWERENKDRVKANVRAYRATKYGISLKEYEVLLKKCNGLCMICIKNEATCIDHCHESGEVRGLLCRPCNLALGFFRDNLSSIKNATKYLERFDAR